ncbi:hypothetical protein [Alkalibacterium thalassium]|uniref:Uncharacterized protein n=1 Tax=Alkalibacterium thalassium TaxID=426701 RepID=A0A1G8VS79_9LACT|nr:hypothetical protein [Alkalibacterium thalassium]SDJ68931.1 hypothetical protein SAMN04488098_100282 [Alkalibacterium thalassium]
MQEPIIRQDLIEYAFDDWRRLIRNGLTPRQARIDVERDYELLEIEVAELNKRMFEEMEGLLEREGD